MEGVVILVIGPLGLLCIACLAFRPIRRLVGYMLLALFLLGLGAFGHVQLIRAYPWLCIAVPAMLWLLTAFRRHHA